VSRALNYERKATIENRQRAADMQAISRHRRGPQAIERLFA